MAKGSYWAKHQEQLHGSEEVRAPRKTYAPITDELKTTFENGSVILIDKPLHWTSFDIVRKIRNSIKIKKVGHAGTLDPLATGLLIVCTGKFTKRINEFMAEEKEYTGSFTLGATTPTYDRESTPENIRAVGDISLQQLQETTKQFLGEIQQVPPVYSAIKKDGVALYELARRGVEVELKPRTINILSFEITTAALPVVGFKVICSTGTYIRSLAHDYGAALGCGAYLSELRRTRIGQQVVSDAVEIETFMQSLGGQRDQPQ